MRPHAGEVGRSPVDLTGEVPRAIHGPVSGQVELVMTTLLERPVSDAPVGGRWLS